MNLVGSVFVSLVLVAGDPPERADAAATIQGGRDFDAPPPGASPEDVALWRRAYDVDNRILLERGIATRLQAAAHAGMYEDRLEVEAKRGGEAATRAGVRQKSLLDAWAENMDLLTRQWPVDPTRACRYPLLTFEGALYARDGATKASQLGAARQEVQECVARAMLPLGALTRSNERLRSVLAELDRELPSVTPVTAGPSGPATTDRAPGGGSQR
jgi:hypothetical protein